MYANPGARERAFNFKKILPGEHSSEHFCCVGTHFQAFINLADVFFLRCFSEARKKHFRRNFRKFSRMRPIVCQKQKRKHKTFCCFWTSLSSVLRLNVSALCLASVRAPSCVEAKSVIADKSKREAAKAGFVNQAEVKNTRKSIR